MTWSVGDEACGGSKSVSAMSVVMSRLPVLGIDRAHRGLRGDERRRADRFRTATRSQSGRSVAEDGAGPAVLLRAVKAALPPTENSWREAIAGPVRLPPRSPPQKAVGAVLSR